MRILAVMLVLLFSVGCVVVTKKKVSYTRSELIEMCRDLDEEK